MNDNKRASIKANIETLQINYTLSFACQNLSATVPNACAKIHKYLCRQFIFIRSTIVANIIEIYGVCKNIAEHGLISS